MAGQRWLTNPTVTGVVDGAPAPAGNGFLATLSGASAVTLDTARMRIDDSRPVTGQLTTDSPLALTLNGTWPTAVTVQIDGVPASFQQVTGGIELSVPAGKHTVSISPA